MKYISLFFIVLNLLIIFCIQIGCVKGIVGGTNAVNDQFPYMVSVQMNNEHICGGSIIGDLHILTAAHCVINEEGKFINEKFSVVPGVVNIKSIDPDVRIGVRIIYVPQEFKLIKRDNGLHYSMISDISVFKLKNTIGLFEKNTLNILSLPTKRNGKYLTYYAEKPIIAGFGIDSLNRGSKRNWENIEIKQDTYSDLKFASTEVLHQRICKSEFKFPNKIIKDRFLCARIQQQIFMNHIGTCKGDSGGSLVVSNTVIGILSINREDCDEHNGSALYTRVSDYIPFINKTFRDDRSPDIRVAIYKKVTEEIENSDGNENLVEIFNQM